MHLQDVAAKDLTSELKASRYLYCFRKAVGLGAFGIAFYYAYYFGMSFSLTCASPIWFPDSVLLCALLLNRPRNWWVFVLATLPIRLLSPVATGVPTWFLLLTFLIDSIKVLLLAAALRQFISGLPRLATVQEFVLYCVFAVLLAPAVSAFAGAGARTLLGNSYWITWGEWFRGGALANLIVAPALLYWLADRPWKAKVRKSHWLELILLGAGLAVAGYFAFSANYTGTGYSEWRSYATVPLMFWAAIRFGMLGASGAVIIIMCFAVNAAVHLHGPFANQSVSGTALVLQNFLFLRAGPLYLIAILTEQRNKAERSMRESENRFRVMADDAPVMLWLSGTDRLCEFINRGWLEFTGRTMEQELGSGWAEGLHPDDVQRCLELYHRSFDARLPFEMEYRLRRHDGEYRWVLDRGVPRHDSNGDFTGYVGTVIDITERKQNEEARHDLIHASRLVMIGEFSAMVAHELSRPLGTILSNSELAEGLLASRNVPIDLVREIVSDIRKDNLRACEVIRHIRSLLSKHEMQLRPIDINEILATVLQLARGDALRRHVQIHNEFGVTLPTVLGDPIYLQQVVLNLVLNGMDAMNDKPESERHLFLRTDWNENGFVEVSIRDVGLGVSPENLARIFDSFFSTKKDGLGIGLSIARSIIQLHSGRLWAEPNADNKGMTFHFTIAAAHSVSKPEKSLSMADHGRQAAPPAPRADFCDV